MSIPEPSRVEIDGIPVWAVQSADPPQVTLTFAVGRLDEGPMDAGTAHLVEHLVMRRVGRSHLDSNATTHAGFIDFVVRGPAEEVADHIARVCDAIRTFDEISDEDVSAEIAAIVSELGEHDENTGSGSLYYRFGPAGPGILEYGSPRHRSITRNDAVQFVRRWFVTGNAAADVIGDIPPALRFPLPAGRRRDPRSVPREIEQTYPLISASAAASLSMSIVVEGGATTRALAFMTLDEALMERLRTQRGLIYDSSVSQASITENRVVLVADLDPSREHLDDCLEALIGLLAELSETGGSDDLIGHSRKKLLVEVGGRSMYERQAAMAAVAELNGEHFASQQMLIDAITAVDIAEVQSVLRGCLSTLLITVGHEVDEGRAESLGLTWRLPPAEHDEFGVGWRQLSRKFASSAVVVLEGRRRSNAAGSVIVIAEDRLDWFGAGAGITVRPDDIAHVQIDPEGIVLVDTWSGFDLVVSPTDIRDKKGDIRAFFERVAPSRISFRQTKWL